MTTAPSRTGPRPGTASATPKQATANLPAQPQGAPATRRSQPLRSAAASTFDDASTAINNLEAAYKFLTERELVPALNGEDGEEGLGGAQPGEAVERVTAEVMGVPGETGPVSTHTYVMACDRHAEGERGGVQEQI